METNMIAKIATTTRRIMIMTSLLKESCSFSVSNSPFIFRLSVVHHGLFSYASVLGSIIVLVFVGDCVPGADVPAVVSGC